MPDRYKDVTCASDMLHDVRDTVLTISIDNGINYIFPGTVKL